MTFKRTKFDESPVMRSFEKVAMERGLIEHDPVVKEASAGESYEPTDNLLSDMIRLANGLREKGFVSEATALEDRIFEHKQAAKAVEKSTKDDGEKMLDEAHPEGDVEVAPSAGGYGKMLTQKTTQDVIKKIVEKTPTGKYAYLASWGSLIEGMSKEYAIAMNVAAKGAGLDHEFDDDDAEDIIEKVIVQNFADKEGNLSRTVGREGMQGIANKFKEIVNNRAAGWAEQIVEERAQYADYSMEQAVNTHAGIAAQLAIDKGQTGGLIPEGEMGCADGVAASVVENIIKATEEALGLVVKKAQDWAKDPTFKSKYSEDLSDNVPDFKTITGDFIENIEWILETDVWLVTAKYWFGEKGHPKRVFEGDRVKDVARMVTPKVHEYLENKATEGYDPAELYGIIKRNVSKNWQRYVVVEKLWRPTAGIGPAVPQDTETLDYSKLLDGILYSDSKIKTLRRTKKWKADEKAYAKIRAARKQMEQAAAGDISRKQLNDGILAPLSRMRATLESIRDDAATYTEEAINTAGAGVRKLAETEKIIGELISDPATAYVTWLNLQQEVKKTMIGHRSSWPKLISALQRYIDNWEKWATDPKRRKSASTVPVHIVKEADEPDPTQFPPEGEKKKDDTPPPKPGVGSNVIKQMQRALQDLAKEVKDPARAKIINYVGKIGPDGDWGDSTETALAEAEKLRSEMNVLTKIVSSQQHKSYARQNLGIIKALIPKVKAAGGGLAYKAKGRSLGKYVTPGGSDVEITDRDVGNLGSFERFLEENRIDLELRTPQFAPEKKTEEKAEKTEKAEKASPAAPAKPPLGAAGLREPKASRKEELRRFAQIPPGGVRDTDPDPWSKKKPRTEFSDPWGPGTEKPKPEEPKEDVPGLTVGQWRRAIKHFKDEALKAHRNEGVYGEQQDRIKNRRDPRELWYHLNDLEKELAKQIDPEAGEKQVVKTRRGRGRGRGLAYTPVPGHPGLVYVYDAPNKRWLGVPPGYQLPEGWSYHLGGPGAGAEGPGAAEPPIGPTIDLSDPRFGLPKKYHEVLFYRDFVNTPGYALANSLFADIEPRSKKRIGMDFAKLHGLEIVEYPKDKYKDRLVVRDRKTKKLVFIDRYPGYKEYYRKARKYHSGTPKERMIIFLQEVSKGLARAYRTYKEDLPRAERKRVLRSVYDWHNDWQQAVEEKRANL